MPKHKLTAVFDIGKTNKKFFLFDDAYNQVHKEYRVIPEVKDEDGFPTEDLPALEAWIKTTFENVLKSGVHEIGAINFSSYGASLVHLSEDGKPLTPLYNYLKPVPDQILEDFYRTYGSRELIEQATGSPITGNLLNSGLQLYWLKKTKPELFHQIKWTLHLPQYLSYLFTGTACNEYSSIGCHTLLWDYRKGDYHEWVYHESIDRLLPPIISTRNKINKELYGKSIDIGIGIHDSSSALLPYLLNETKPFLLLSTGTWSIALNAFDTKALSDEDSFEGDLMYMRIDGQPVRASRYFLGDTYKKQVSKLCKHFRKLQGYHKQVRFQQELFIKLKGKGQPHFIVENIAGESTSMQLEVFSSFEEAYHQLMIELVTLQSDAIKRAIGRTVIEKIYIDGGFVENDIFIKLIAFHFPKLKVCTTRSPLGSALGAAMVLASQQPPKNFLKRHYKMKKLKPLDLVNS